MILCAAAIPGGEDEIVKALREDIRQLDTEPLTYQDFRSAFNEAAGPMRSGSSPVQCRLGYCPEHPGREGNRRVQDFCGKSAGCERRGFSSVTRQVWIWIKR